MRSLERWFRRQAARTQRTVLLEDALLSGRDAAYASYRLRYFIGRFSVTAVLHVVEFTILLAVFSHRTLIAAILVRALSSFLSAFWWGALETMRGQIRDLHQRGRSHRIAHEFGGYLQTAVLGSILVFAATLAWIVLDLARPLHTLQPFHLYVFATGLRLALGLPTRAFHSAVYATRRVYRPFVALVAVQLVTLVGTLLLWPFLGVWSFPVMLTPAAVAGNALTFIYTRRLYRFLGIGSVELNWKRAAHTLSRHAINPEFWLAGLSFALMRLDGILVVAMFFGAQQGRDGFRLLVLFYLIGPLIRATSEWAQLFYFDFKRLELDLFNHMRRRLSRLVLRVAAVVGIGASLLACLAGTLVFHRNLAWIYLFLMFFFLVRAQLAYLQIRAFTEHRYKVLFATGLMILSAVFFAGSVLAGQSERLGLLVLSLLIAAACLAILHSAAKASRSSPERMPPFDWLASLRGIRRPVRVRSVSFCRDANDWMVGQIAKNIARSIGNHGALSILKRQQICWFECRAIPRPPSRSWVLRQGVGLIENVTNCEFQPDGAQAIEAARVAGVLAPLLKECAPPPTIPNSIDEIKHRFSDLCPQGVLYDAAEPIDDELRGLSPRWRHELVFGAIQYLKDPLARPGRMQLEVSALAEQGTLRLLFALPRTVARNARITWKRFIDTENVSRSITQTTQNKEWIPMNRKKLAYCTVAATVLAAIILSAPMEERVTGEFRLLPLIRENVSSPVSGYFTSAIFAEGDAVTAGAPMITLDVPDLAGRIVRTKAEIREVQASLRYLTAAPPPIPIDSSRQLRPAREKERRHNERVRRAAQEGIQLVASKPTPRSSGPTHRRPGDDALAGLLNARAVAESARLDRLVRELEYLRSVDKQRRIFSPADGWIARPRWADPQKRFVAKGEVICQIAEADVLEAEIIFPEQDLSRIETGQTVVFKARALPFETFTAIVERVAPIAVPGETSSTGAVFCRIENPPAPLRAGMSGYGRVRLGSRSIGSIMLQKLARFVRTEFWW